MKRIMSNDEVEGTIIEMVSDGSDGEDVIFKRI